MNMNHLNESQLPHVRANLPPRGTSRVRNSEKLPCNQDRVVNTTEKSSSRGFQPRPPSKPRALTSSIKSIKSPYEGSQVVQFPPLSLPEVEQNCVKNVQSSQESERKLKIIILHRAAANMVMRRRFELVKIPEKHYRELKKRKSQLDEMIQEWDVLKIKKPKDYTGKDIQILKTFIDKFKESSYEHEKKNSFQ